MGFYDRDYQRGGYYEERQPGFHLGASTRLTTKLVIVTFVVYLAQFLSNQWLTEIGSLHSDWWRRPWFAYQLLTYGFLHDPGDLKHIGFNMLGLWIFGRDVEARYGSREFLTFYLIGIIVGGLVWSLAELPSAAGGAMMGASGGVSAVVILFAMNFPYRTVLFMFVFPMPMWVLAVILVAADAWGAIHRPGAGNVAYTAHLGGAAFGFLYYRSRIRLERWLPDQFRMPKLRPKPKLRVHDPEPENETTDSRVDDILRKIKEHGQDSLTRHERSILEQASREYQKRRL